VFESSIPAQPGQFAATDMLHRRAPLPFRFQLALGESAVCIKTDSGLMGEALRGLGLSVGSNTDLGDAEWEIAVEEWDESSPLPTETEEEDSETYCVGPSRSFRIADGSWFAHTPPSLSGVGYAMVAGGECNQVQQLGIYIKTILRFVADGNAESFPAVASEVSV